MISGPLSTSWLLSSADGIGVVVPQETHDGFVLLKHRVGMERVPLIRCQPQKSKGGSRCQAKNDRWGRKYRDSTNLPRIKAQDSRRFVEGEFVTGRDSPGPSDGDLSSYPIPTVPGQQSSGSGRRRVGTMAAVLYHSG